MIISVVTTLYYSAPYIKEFYERTRSTLEDMKVNYEFVIVNDGSPDHALNVAIELANLDSKVRVVDLSKNFGHHKAFMTGIAHTNGDLVFLNDCDLEESPELIQTFFEEWQKYQGEADVIYGVQRERDGGWFRRVSGHAFYKLFNFLSGEKVPRNLSMTRLMTRRYADQLIKHQDKTVFIAGLFELTGFCQKPLIIDKTYKGQTTYTVSKRFSIVFNAVTAFSSRPLILIGVLGFGMSLIVFLYATYLVYRKVVHGITIDGWTSMMVSIWFLGGIIIFSLGVIGIYIARIFMETKDRPYTIVRQIYQNNKDCGSR